MFGSVGTVCDPESQQNHCFSLKIILFEGPEIIPGLPGFQSAPLRAKISMSVTPTDSTLVQKASDLEVLGCFQHIKTALVDVSHEKKVCDTMNLKSYGELDCD